MINLRKDEMALKKEATYKLMKLNADTLTPIELFQRLTGEKKFLLESTFQHETKGKYSFIGCHPYGEIIGYDDTTEHIDYINHTDKTIDQNALTYLEEHLPHISIDLPLPFYGGAIGYVGYDAIRSIEDIGETLTNDLAMPDIHFMLYKNILVFDHASEILYVIAIRVDADQANDLDYQLEHLRKQIQQTNPTSNQQETPFTFYPEISKEAFQQQVVAAKKHIQQGDIFQVVLSQRMKATFEGDTFSFYRQLRKVNPSPYMFYIDFGEYLILGASPESLIETRGRNVMTNPIAGTRPRGKTLVEDERLMKELLKDDKEIAEHRMLVDLSRNDLGRICEIGSIHIPTYMTIEKYQHVMHIVSEVHGKLRKGCSSFTALISCLPAGTVSGAPKIRAMQIINELEGTKRGVYGGGIGFINYNHDVTMALAIRSLVVKEKHAYLQTGAGIVHDSEPDKEYLETLFKAKSLMEVSTNDFTTG